MSGKRNKKEIIEGVQRILERKGRFDREMLNYGTRWRMPNGSYKYRQPWYSRIATGFYRGIMLLLTPLILKVVFRAKIIGRQNLKAVGKSGAITVCNHFHYLDTLFIRQAIGHVNSFHTMAPWNNKTGVGGHIMRHGGTWPLSSTPAAVRNFTAEMERQLLRGKRVNFYPEHSLWWNYPKPRPMKEGAFRYAVKFNVPVIPVFCTFKKSKRGGAKKLRINILPAVYADTALPQKESAKKMKEAAENLWKECYERDYGIPLNYGIF